MGKFSLWQKLLCRLTPYHSSELVTIWHCEELNQDCLRCSKCGYIFNDMLTPQESKSEDGMIQYTDKLGKYDGDINGILNRNNELSCQKIL